MQHHAAIAIELLSGKVQRQQTLLKRCWVIIFVTLEKLVE